MLMWAVVFVRLVLVNNLVNVLMCIVLLLVSNCLSTSQCSRSDDMPRGEKKGDKEDSQIASIATWNQRCAAVHKVK